MRRVIIEFKGKEHEQELTAATQLIEIGCGILREAGCTVKKVEQTLVVSGAIQIPGIKKA